MALLKIAIAVVALIFWTDAPAHAVQPLEAIKAPIEEVLKILQDPQYQTPEKKKLQQQKIREISQDIFDYPEIAKRSLAYNWKIFTPQQRKEFTRLFSDLIEDNYLNKIQKGYHDETVRFLVQEMITENRARVQTLITRSNMEIPVDYSMQLKDRKWQIYDVQVAGVSLIKNYRSQFNKILLNKSPQQLIEQLEKKTVSEE